MAPAESEEGREGLGLLSRAVTGRPAEPTAASHGPPELVGLEVALAQAEVGFPAVAVAAKEVALWEAISATQEEVALWEAVTAKEQVNVAQEVPLSQEVAISQEVCFQEIGVA
ncbi:unnamed protein product [Prorocentrum cordatum]|uniref:Uncharacterized protein n=1 Tax=Prorocentrum cordatum TaxID=2364126 RepID=A0ABN9XEM3_9DINO|nr:unnamed protein product [Polarella glacialis]